MIDLSGVPEPPRPATNTPRIVALLIDAGLLLMVGYVLLGLLALLLIGLEAAGEETAAFDVASAATPVLQAIRGAPRWGVASVLYGLYAIPY